MKHSDECVSTDTAARLLALKDAEIERLTKALAEQREEIGKLIASDNEAWTRRLAEQEARHAREIERARLEAKIEMLEWCLDYTDHAMNFQNPVVRVRGYDVQQLIDKYRAALAALDAKADAGPTEES